MHSIFIYKKKHADKVHVKGALIKPSKFIFGLQYFVIKIKKKSHLASFGRIKYFCIAI